jgi:hypothetical protein
MHTCLGYVSTIEDSDSQCDDISGETDADDETDDDDDDDDDDDVQASQLCARCRRLEEPSMASHQMIASSSSSRTLSVQAVLPSFVTMVTRAPRQSQRRVERAAGKGT